MFYTNHYGELNFSSISIKTLLVIIGISTYILFLYHWFCGGQIDYAL